MDLINSQPCYQPTYCSGSRRVDIVSMSDTGISSDGNHTDVSTGYSEVRAMMMKELEASFECLRVSYVAHMRAARRAGDSLLVAVSLLEGDDPQEISRTSLIPSEEGGVGMLTDRQ